MLFKGTSNRTAKDISEAFDHIGGEINAFTGREETCYFTKVLDEHSELAIDILSDMLFNSLLDTEDFENEKQVILEEINMYEDTPDDLVHDMLYNTIFGDHALGRPVLGTKETLANLTPNHLRNYMNRHYTPDKLIISIAGNVSDALIKKAEQTFGSMAIGNPVLPPHQPVFHTSRIIKKKDSEQGHLCLGFEGFESRHEDLLSLLIINNILGGNTSSRLFQEVREKKGLAYSVFSDHTEYRDAGVLSIYGGSGKKQLNELLDTILSVIEKFKKVGIEENELKNNLSQLRGSLLLNMESSGYRMNRNAENEMIYHQPKTAQEVLNEFEKITVNDVNRVLHTVFDKNYAVSIIKPI